MWRKFGNYLLVQMSRSNEGLINKRTKEEVGPEILTDSNNKCKNPGILTRESSFDDKQSRRTKEEVGPETLTDSNNKHKNPEILVDSSNKHRNP